MHEQSQSIFPDFRVAVLERLGGPLTLREARVAGPLMQGQVLIRMILSGVCGSQIHEIAGRKGPDRYLPHTLGHEGVGEVFAIGPGVTKVRQGDKVILHWRAGDGIVAPAVKYASSIGEVNAGPVTTFSEFSVVSENRITPLPSNVPDKVAPLFGCSLTTAFGSVVREANVTPGQSAVIVGFGGVGISILKALRLVSASPIVVLDIDKRKSELALTMGATHAETLEHTEAGVETLVSSIIGGKPDVVFEVTGLKHMIEQSYEMTSDAGKTVLVGVPDTRQPATIQTLPLHLGKSIIGSHGGSSNPSVDIPKLARLISSGLLTLNDIPQTVFPFDEVNSALDSMRDGIPGRVMISFDE